MQLRDGNCTMTRHRTRPAILQEMTIKNYTNMEHDILHTLRAKAAVALLLAIFVSVNAWGVPRADGLAGLFPDPIDVTTTPMGSCGDNASYSFDSDTGMLTISGSGAISDYKFWNNNAIKIVFIGPAITEIGAGTFVNCPNLKTLVIDGDGENDVALEVADNAFCYKVENLLDYTSPISYIYYARNKNATVAVTSFDTANINLFTLANYTFGNLQGSNLYKIGHDDNFKCKTTISYGDGTRSIDWDYAVANSTVTLTPPSGKVFTAAPTVTFDETSIDVTAAANGTYTFIMPAGNVSVSAVIGYSITMPAGVTATVDGTAVNGAAEGAEVTLTPPSGKVFTAAPTVTFGETSVDVTAAGNGSYTFTMPAGNVSVSGSVVQAYAITMPAGVTATVGGTAVNEAAEGAEVTLTPASGKVFTTVPTVTFGENAVDVTEAANGTYTFIMPAAGVSVSAVVGYPITMPAGVTATVGGTVVSAAAEGAEVSFTYTGEVAGIEVTDGTTNADATAGTNGTYTFTMPAAPVTVRPYLTNVKYIWGSEQDTGTDKVYILSGSETTLTGGYYIANSNLNYTSTLGISGSVQLIIADGVTMTVNGVTSGNGYLDIHAQSLGSQAGTLVAPAPATIAADAVCVYSGIVNGDISAYKISISGGQVTAGSIAAIGQIYLSWSSPTDFIKAGAYTAEEYISCDKPLAVYSIDNNTETLITILGEGKVSGEYNDEDVKYYYPLIAGKVLRPAAGITLPEGVTATVGGQSYSGTVDLDNVPLAPVGATVTLTPASGQVFAAAPTVTFGETSVDVTAAGNGTYTFTMPEADVSVSATMVYVITMPAGVTATVGGTAVSAAAEGAEVSFTYTDQVAGIEVTDGSTNADATAAGNGTYTFTMPAAPVTVRPYLTNVKFMSNLGEDNTGTDKTYILSGSETTLTGFGYYIANSNLSYTSTLGISGFVNLIIADGVTMTVSGGTSGDGYLLILAQSLGSQAGTLVAPDGVAIAADRVTVHSGIVNGNISTNRRITISGGIVNGDISTGSITISGGQVTAGSIAAIGNINLSWSSPTDFIQAGTYTLTEGSISCKNPLAVYSIDNNTETLSTILGEGKVDGSDSYALIAGKVLRPAAGITSLPEGVTATVGGQSYIGTVYIDNVPLAPVGAEVTLSYSGSLTNYYYTYTDGTTTVTVPSGTNTFVMPAANTTVSIVEGEVIALQDNADNSSVIGANNNQTVNVVLSGRTLYRDGDWNTLCLPFAVSSFTGTPLDGATVMALDATTSNLSSDGTLTLAFTTATSIEAGKPYIVKWETTGTDIVNPVFNGVTFTSTTPTAVTFSNAQDNGDCQFVGQYSPFAIDDSNIGEIVLLGSGNKLGYSAGARTLRSCRAHFYVPTTGTQGAVRSYTISYGDEQTTGIMENADSILLQGDDAYYTLDGRKLPGKPSRKGMYLHNGKKIIIR